MAQAIRFHRTGGPDVLTLESVDVGKPGRGEVRMRNTAIGVNFIDTYQRSGLYPMQLPSGLGTEAAGVVLEVGEGVDWLQPGDRVATCTSPVGAYSTERNVPADKLVKLPDGIEERTAAAMMLKGLTVQYLFRQTYPLKAGQTILFHAAAGGVGLIACQWARALGVTMIGTAGSDEKAELARQYGCAHTIVYTRENFVERVKAITGGKGVPVVYDSVGRVTFESSLKCLRPRGILASFGESSGDPPLVSVRELGQMGSLFVTHPSLIHYTESRAELLETANDLFAMVGSGKIKIEINHSYPLRETAQAHRDVEARKTTGSVVLIP
jgi:NADPH2:quinone reductase